jgi:hypothetical protein
MTLFGYNACRPAAGQITIVTNGSSRYVIVLPLEATKNETHAASVLQDYIKRMSGAALPVITENTYKEQPGIFIGNTEHAEKYNTGKLKGEGFFIASDDKQVYIKGGSGKGIVYGVYTLLERYLGCRKYAEGPATVPATKNIRVPQQLMDRQEPPLVYRETYYPAAFENEYLEWHKLHRLEDLWGVWGHSFFKIVPPKTYSLPIRNITHW